MAHRIASPWLLPFVPLGSLEHGVPPCLPANNQLRKAEKGQTCSHSCMRGSLVTRILSLHVSIAAFPSLAFSFVSLRCIVLGHGNRKKKKRFIRLLEPPSN